MEPFRLFQFSFHHAHMHSTRNSKTWRTCERNQPRLCVKCLYSLSLLIIATTSVNHRWHVRLHKGRGTRTKRGRNNTGPRPNAHNIFTFRATARIWSFPAFIYNSHDKTTGATACGAAAYDTAVGTCPCRINSFRVLSRGHDQRCWRGVFCFSRGIPILLSHMSTYVQYVVFVVCLCHL